MVSINVVDRYSDDTIQCSPLPNLFEVRADYQSSTALHLISLSQYFLCVFFYFNLSGMNRNCVSFVYNTTKCRSTLLRLTRKNVRSVIRSLYFTYAKPGDDVRNNVLSYTVSVEAHYLAYIIQVLAA